MTVAPVSVEKRVLKLRTQRKINYVDFNWAAACMKTKGVGDKFLSVLESSDRVAGVYEGGLKLWECSIDLCQYLDENPACSTDCKDKAVLELGCGAGLPGILTIMKGATHVTFQDFNQEILDYVTRLNCEINCSDIMRHNVSTKFVSGDWSTIQQNFSDKYDMVLTSETIYERNSYGDLHALLLSVLKPTGVVLLAAKQYYFGLSGNLPVFLEFIDNLGVFDHRPIWTSDTGVKRSIIELKLK